MPPEIKEAIEAVNKAIADFRAANDTALKDMASKGHVDALLTENMAKLNARIDTAYDKVKALEAQSVHADELERKVNLLQLNPPGRQDGKPTEAELAKAMAQIKTGRLDAELDVEQYRAFRAALPAYLRMGGDALAPEMRAAMSVGSDPSGGYLVPPDMSGRIVRLVYESSPVRQVANVQQISTDRLDGYTDLGEAGAGWVGETAARTETTTPDVGKYDIPVHELYAEPRATQKLLDDAAWDVEAFLMDKVGRKFGRMEATAFVSGNGVSQPRGFLTYDHGVPAATSTAAWRKIERVASGAAGAFLNPSGSPSVNPADPFITMIGKMKAIYRAGLRWAMNRSTWAAVRKIKDVDGNYVFGPQVVNGILQFQLFGFPVDEFEDLPDIAANSLSIALANWAEAYTIVDRVGLRTLRDPYTTKGYVKLYTTTRVGGDVTNFEAIKLMRMATAAA